MGNILPLAGLEYFYPRPPRGGRPNELSSNAKINLISIHALREEGDLDDAYSMMEVQRFLSTPSARRATPAKSISNSATKFLSTPSARRATLLASPHLVTAFYFYPRPPRGGRPILQTMRTKLLLFLSTPSARRATLFFTGHDIILWNFYPRPPRGGRPMTSRYFTIFPDFYPRPPRGGRRFPYRDLIIA